MTMISPKSVPSMMSAPTFRNPFTTFDSGHYLNQGISDAQSAGDMNGNGGAETEGYRADQARLARFGDH